ncbi:MAG: hypothetical protein WCO78_00340 [Candidatus Roizmanbacteria bacterium]
MFNLKSFVFTKNRLIWCLVVLLLIGANMTVSVRAMSMTNKAMYYEQEITQYKQENMKLEEKLVAQSSVHSLSEIFEANGYAAPKSAVKWIGTAVVAAR